MSRKNPLPGPDVSGTDPNAVLRSRINLSIPVGAPPNPPPAPAHTPVREGGEPVRAGKGGTRPDPVGMRRTSLYITAEAAEALERAADRIVEILGDGTPRHQALSALLLAGVSQADAVTQDLARQRAAELQARLAALPPLT
ncbi:hypothetical protein AB0L82_43345 [Nocardia sp. NPDC052001]|uniref:hypothetical protein n=1 Tax=Nocardia sp. NPDC052001 TaxID=3154853 RepID=UPI003449FCE7